jgi:hypothetical protein
LSGKIAAQLIVSAAATPSLALSPGQVATQPIVASVTARGGSILRRPIPATQGTIPTSSIASAASARGAAQEIITVSVARSMKVRYFPYIVGLGATTVNVAVAEVASDE